MSVYYADDAVTLYAGDRLEVLPTLPDNSVDAVVTDPPYGLEFMGKEWDKFGDSAARFRKPTEADAEFRVTRGSLPDAYRAGRPFQQWCQLWAAECLRVLKPGGHLLAFGGTRTWHRLAVAIEDAGFEIRDTIAYLYGSGFPKSLRVSRDERFCHCDASVHTSSRTSPELQQDDHIHTADVSGAAEGAAQSAPHGMSALPDSHAGYRPEPDSDGAPPHLAVADDPTLPQLQGCAPGRSRSDVLADGQAAGSSHSPSPAPHSGHPSNPGYAPLGHSPNGAPLRTLANTSPAGTSESARRTPGTDLNPSSLYGTGLPVCLTCGKPQADGLGTALKPAHEPIVVARKPLTGTVAANVLAHGTGALNIDGCRIGSGGGTRGATAGPQGAVYSDGLNGAFGEVVPGLGRWPANVALDETAAAALDHMSGELPSSGGAAFGKGGYGGDVGSPEWGQNDGRPIGFGDTGGASRFFYTAKAGSDERITHGGTAHPTVKPLSLMRWLVRLVTPPGGVILEPFAGSGTTVEAAILEGFRCIAIEREPDYLPLITQRINRRLNPVAYLAAAGEDLGLFDEDPS